MGASAGPERVISEVTYPEAMKRFKALLVAEKLPVREVATARWFCSEVSIGALVVASASLGRIKATATFPEWRGFGYGEDMLWHLIGKAKDSGLTRIEVFSKHPEWFERQGFAVDRMTTWGTPVMRAGLAQLNRG